MVRLVIDQREIDAQEGETVLQAAGRHGIDIPHFCYHDKLSVAGSCRMCLVKVNGLPKLQPACNLVVAPKMTVETQARDVDAARRNVLQFILLNHPVDCGICDKAGECRLQDYQHRFGGSETRSRDAKLHKRKLHDLGERITLDNERCILCSRCVRFTSEISGSHALGIVARGQHEYVESLVPGRFDDPYSDNVIGLCPVGALLSKDFLYECRVWFLEPVRSVCTGCARGCTLSVWRRKKHRELRMPDAPQRQAYRITVRENPDVNGPWLCNKGFDQHKLMARERLPHALVAGRPASTDAAIEEARARLAAARRPAVLVSSQAANEELDAVAVLLDGRVPAYVHADHLPIPGEVIEDALLIRADKNPNRAGAVARFGDRPYDAAAGHDLVVVWGEIAAGTLPPDVAWIHLTPFATPTDAPATVAIPISTAWERSGSFTNFEGKVSAFDAVFDKPAHVAHAVEVFRRLG